VACRGRRAGATVACGAAVACVQAGRAQPAGQARAFGQGLAYGRLGTSHAVPLRSHARSWPSTVGANVVVMVYHDGLSYLSRSPSASTIMVGFKVLLLLYVHINGSMKFIWDN